ncbi:capsule biosynthesis protein CapK [Enterococcus gilvus]|uniref:capsule biosynthesis protein CapK n=1 Tax=Enterococcus gilvus TaxID=160453 RepID=UPI003D6A5908
MSTIDFIIPWVDDSDIEWQIEKEEQLNGIKLTQEQKAMVEEKAFRDWGILKYWFRSVEIYAPWVNKIHFVTYGHIPEWLNTNHVKINIVKHSDYLPKNSLPTFNSRSIEINFHRIKGLSEQFVYFNDDMFLNDYVKEIDFFQNGIPCDSGIFSQITPVKFGTASVQVNNIEIINDHFSFDKLKRHNKCKYLNLKYGKQNLRNIFLMQSKYFVGFYESHLPNAFSKKTFEELWDKEKEILNSTTISKFKNKYNVNQWLFRDWQLASGKFNPRKSNFGKYYELSSNNEILYRDIKDNKYKLICINDSFLINDFNSVKKEVVSILDQKYPHKSSYEL